MLLPTSASITTRRSNRITMTTPVTTSGSISCRMERVVVILPIIDNRIKNIVLVVRQVRVQVRVVVIHSTRSEMGCLRHVVE